MGWVFLNLYTFCIPLVIYFLVPILGIGGSAALTPEEKRKAAVINNFSCPNERESILEALLFIKSQMTVLASGKIDRNIAKWAKIWKTKANQLYQMAEMLFQGDKIANSAYHDILLSEKKIKRSLTLRMLIGVVLISVFVIFAYNKAPVSNSIRETARESTATFEWPSTGIATQLPLPTSSKGEIIVDDNAMFWVEVKDVSDSQYEQYIADCKSLGYVVEAEKNSLLYQAYNAEGYHVQLLHSTGSTELTITAEAPMKMSDIEWPKSAIAKRLPIPESLYGSINWEADYGFVIYIGNTTRQDYKRYVDACYDSGFNVEYKRGDDYFHAKDSDGYDVDIDYKGNNVMFVRIDEPDDN